MSMKIKAAALEGYLEDMGVTEKVYGVLVADIGRDIQIGVVVEARADVVAAIIARNVYYETHGQPRHGIVTHTHVVHAPTVVGSRSRDDYFRLEV